MSSLRGAMSRSSCLSNARARLPLGSGSREDTFDLFTVEAARIAPTLLPLLEGSFADSPLFCRLDLGEVETVSRLLDAPRNAG